MNLHRLPVLPTAATAAATPQNMPGALIIGGAQVSLGIARSLGRRGIPVWLVADHPIAKFSRYVQRSFPWHGLDDCDGVAALVGLAERYGLAGWVLLATGDEDMRVIAQNQDLLAPHFRVATADWATMRWLFDKRLTYQRAASLDIDCPATHLPRDVAECERLDLRFPVVLKPACRHALNEFTRSKAWRADDRAALLRLYRRAAAQVGDDAVIVQELIPGAGDTQFSHAGLWNNGEAIASLVARRTRQLPVDFGRSSTFVETVEDAAVEALARHFLQSLNYTGVAEVEFKYDRRDRRYKLLDVNGRFWTWVGLGGRAGVDLPYLAWQQAVSQSVSPRHGKSGVAWMHTSRDLLAAWREVRQGTLTIANYLAGFRKPLAFANFALDDPMPALVELPVLAWNQIAVTSITRIKRGRRRDYTDGLAVGSQRR